MCPLFLAMLVLGCGGSGEETNGVPPSGHDGNTTSVSTHAPDTGVDPDATLSTGTDTATSLDTNAATNDSGTPASTDGIYRSMDLEMTAEVMGASETCSGGEASLTVSSSDKPQVTGSLLCSFTGGLMAGIDVQATLSGTLTPTMYEVEGTLVGDAEGYPLAGGIWSGSISGNTLTATLSGTADLDGFPLVLSGSFTAVTNTP